MFFCDTHKKKAEEENRFWKQETTVFEKYSLSLVWEVCEKIYQQTTLAAVFVVGKMLVC